MTISYTQGVAQLNDYRMQIMALREQMREVQRAIEPQLVDDYAFEGPDGSVTLDTLLNDRSDLIVIHNMGQACAYCTLWADGFNGVYDHVRQRAAFVLTTPDTVSTQQSLAKIRGWQFPILSHAGTSFAEDMGYGSEDSGWHPGVSVFQRHGGKMARVSSTQLGPWDDFCVLWHLFDLMPAGVDGFEAKLNYA